MFMLQLKCDSSKHQVTKTKGFCNFNWDTKCSVMQKIHSHPSVKIIHTKSILKEHKLSFGTQRILVHQGVRNRPNACCEHYRSRSNEDRRYDGPPSRSDNLRPDIPRSDGFPPRSSRDNPHNMQRAPSPRHPTWRRK
jgi:hypothetical protein